jgi:hypothetical protein
MESRKLLSKEGNFHLLSPLPMWLKSPLADTNIHFAPVSTTEPLNAGKETSKTLLDLPYY